MRQPGIIVLQSPRKVSIDKLHFDVDNIRIGHRNFESEEAVAAALWEMPDMDLLYDDIKRRGLEEPPIVDHHSVVLEGNRRLAVCKRLNEEQNKGVKLQHDFSKILCKEIDPSTSELDKEAFLASVHIAGKYEWPDVSQGRLLKKLHEERNLSFETLAEITRKSKATVIKKIAAYELLERYRKKFSNDQDWADKYPHMWELLRKDLEDIRDDTKKFDMFMRWLHEGRISNSKDVRLLNLILKNPKALRALQEEGMGQAIYKLMIQDPSIRSPTYKKITNITKLLYAFPTKDFVETLNDEVRISVLQDLHKATKRLLDQIQSAKGDKK